MTAEIYQFPTLKALYGTDGEFIWPVEQTEMRDMKELLWLLQLHQDNFPQFVFWIQEVNRDQGR